MSDLNYNHLRYFWSVARQGSLTRASNTELHLTPQTVSSQIKELEKNLGAKLFVRSGRGLALTAAGRMAFKLADEIFSMGKKLTDTFAGRPVARSQKLIIGVADVIPKLVAERIIAPALNLDIPIQLICKENDVEPLLGELAVHRLDLVLSDAPIPPMIKIRAYNHGLGECGITFMVASTVKKNLKKKFPQSLNGTPFLLPAEGTVLRSSLDLWFDDHSLSPKIVGEFQDSALLKAFGQTGAGVFAVPSIIEKEVQRQYKTRAIGFTNEITEKFYAISTERRIKDPAIDAICRRAKTDLFRSNTNNPLK